VLSGQNGSKCATLMFDRKQRLRTHSPHTQLTCVFVSHAGCRMYEMWLVQELADKGTLSDAMKAGWLSQAAPPGRNMVRAAIVGC
jgi:hypothetical protein